MPNAYCTIYTCLARTALYATLRLRTYLFPVLSNAVALPFWFSKGHGVTTQLHSDGDENLYERTAFLLTQPHTAHGGWDRYGAHMHDVLRLQVSS